MELKASIMSRTCLERFSYAVISYVICARPMLVNFIMKFHKDILNGFQVTERTRFCDRTTDGQTTVAKNNMSSKPDIVNKLCLE